MTLFDDGGLDAADVARLFTEARTANAFSSRVVLHETLERAVKLALFGPTSANALPMRLVFVESDEAKRRLEPALDERNRAKTMAAPLTTIVATDSRFHEHFPRLFPARGEAFFALYDEMSEPERLVVARDNALLQMGYLVLALRAVGLAAGPMAGFDRARVDATFFPERRFTTLYLINVGYADTSHDFPRLPRFRPRDITQFT